MKCIHIIQPIILEYSLFLHIVYIKYGFVTNINKGASGASEVVLLQYYYSISSILGSYKQDGLEPVAGLGCFATQIMSYQLLWI
jgi:hypothetical protein